MTREQVIKAVEQHNFTEECIGCPYMYEPNCRKRLQADAIALLKEQEASPWISVKDRLPEKEGQYLCWAHINKIGCNYQILLWRDNCWYWVHDVLYWMPLPELPKEVDDAGLD